MIGNDMDTELLLTLNSLAGNSILVDKILSGISNNPLIRGFPIFFALVALWFSGDSKERRARMLTGLFATCLATVLSVWLQYHITPHVRPVFDPALPLKIMAPWVKENWERLGSFPSDTATLYFSLVAVSLPRKPNGRIALLFLGLGRRRWSRCLWMALSKRHRWLFDFRAGMRLFVQQNSIP